MLHMISPFQFSGAKPSSTTPDAKTKQESKLIIWHLNGIKENPGHEIREK